LSYAKLPYRAQSLHAAPQERATKYAQDAQALLLYSQLALRNLLLRLSMGKQPQIYKRIQIAAGEQDEVASLSLPICESLSLFVPPLLHLETKCQLTLSLLPLAILQLLCLGSFFKSLLSGYICFWVNGAACNPHKFRSF